MLKAFTSLNQRKMAKYPSKYSPGKEISAAQYIAEIICEKQAKNKKQELGIKFWQDEAWAKIYKFQLWKAQGLVKLYNEIAIIKALASKEAKYIYSLGSPKLDDLIQREVRIIKAKEQSVKKVEIKELGDTKAQPRTTFVKPKNEFSKLDNI